MCGSNTSVCFYYSSFTGNRLSLGEGHSGLVVTSDSGLDNTHCTVMRIRSIDAIKYVYSTRTLVG